MRGNVGVRNVTGMKNERECWSEKRNRYGCGGNVSLSRCDVIDVCWNLCASIYCILSMYGFCGNFFK